MTTVFLLTYKGFLTRVFEMSGISILAETATHGVFIGASSQRHLTITKGQIYGPQYGIYCAESVYFLGIKNVDIRSCDIGVYAGAYCDLLTIEDRCLFSANRTCDIMLECPTFYIANNDFEGGDNATAAIKVSHTSASVAELRAGLIFSNRFGPELPFAGTTTYRYDIWIYDNGAVGAMDSLKVINNHHASYTDTRQKLWPVYIDGKVKRIYFNRNTFGGYPAEYIGGDQVKAFASGTSFIDNFIDNIFNVTDDLKGLFSRTQSKHVRPLLAAANIAKFAATRLAGYNTNYGYSSATVGTLGAASSGNNYNKYAGIAIHAAAANRIVWVGEPGLIIDTTLDATGKTFGDPLYLQGDGSINFTSINLAFRIARILTINTNAKVILQPQDHTGT